MEMQSLAVAMQLLLSPRCGPSKSGYKKRHSHDATSVVSRLAPGVWCRAGGNCSLKYITRARNRTLGRQVLVHPLPRAP